MSGEINKRISKIQTDLTPEKLAKEAFPFLVKETPIDTGNARRNTKQQRDIIIGQYPYAVPLDKGHSKQAPNGMIKPTIEYIKKYIQKYSKGH